VNLDNEKQDFKQWLANEGISPGDALGFLGLENFGDIKDYTQAREVIATKRKEK